MATILLAEDDASMREYLARALERTGYAITTADGGPSALARLEWRKFDLLLTDVMMPEIDGIELARRAVLIQPDIRVIFITGFAAVTLRNGGFPADARLLSKPFHLRELVAEVRAIFPLDEAADV